MDTEVKISKAKKTTFSFFLYLLLIQVVESSIGIFGTFNIFAALLCQTVAKKELHLFMFVYAIALAFCFVAYSTGFMSLVCITNIVILPISGLIYWNAAADFTRGKYISSWKLLEIYELLKRRWNNKIA